MAGFHKDFVEFGEGSAVHCSPGHKQQIASRGEKILAEAKYFTQTALGAVALDGGTHGRDRGGDHQPGLPGGLGAGVLRTQATPGGERAAIEPLSLLADGPDLGLAAEMLLV